jgi:phospholipid/cholesterol/gamma-HCH transport system substrate-binding protein
MSWLKSLELKVGALVVVVGGLVGAMSMQVSDDPAFFSRKQKAYFLLDSATGLIKGSTVKTAGIPVGVIKDISLQNGRARVDISVDQGLGLKSSAGVQIKSAGILGDKHVEVYPGGLSDPELPDGGQILNVSDQGALDNVLSKVGEIAESLKKVSDNLADAVSEDGTNKHILGRIVQNIEKLTSDLSQITSENKEQIGEIVDQVNNITTTLDDLINDESDKGFKKTWKNTMARLDATMKNVEEISSKINKGEGTIGKLVNDETTVEELNTAIQGVSSLFDSASRLQTAFDFHGAYLGEVGETRTTIGVHVQPGPDRFYLLGIVDDPAGLVRETNTLITNPSDGSTVSDLDEKKTYKNKTKFTALYGMNFWDLTVRGGLIESSGGLGIDYHFFRRKLKFTVEAFDFGDTNLRFQASYKIAWGLYLLAGFEDALDNQGKQSGYLGAGLFLTNDDLKLLLVRGPF